MDVAEISPGENFVTAINNSVDKADAIIAAIGPRWLSVTDNDGVRRIDDEFDYVRLEISRGIDRGLPIFPVLFDGANMPVERALPEPLKPISYFNAVSLPFDHYLATMDKFIDDLERIGYEKRRFTLAYDSERVTDFPTYQKEDDHRSQLFLGIEFLERGLYAEAEEKFSSVASGSWIKNGYNDILTLRAQHWLSVTLRHIGKMQEAASLNSIVLSIQSSNLSKQSEDYISSLHECAIISHEFGNFIAAKKKLEDVIDAATETFGEYYRLTSEAKSSYASVLLDLGLASEAAAIWQDVLTAKEAVLDPRDRTLRILRSNVAFALLSQGLSVQAESIWTKWYPIWLEVAGPDHPDILATRANIALCKLFRGLTSQAENEILAVISDGKRILDETHTFHSFWYGTLCDIFLAKGTAREAKELAIELLSKNDATWSELHPNRIMTMYRLARAQLQLGEVDTATKNLGDVAVLAADSLAATDPRQGYISLLLAQAAEASGDSGAADMLLAEAEANWGNRLTAEHPYRQQLLAFLKRRPGDA